MNEVSSIEQLPTVSMYMSLDVYSTDLSEMDVDLFLAELYDESGLSGADIAIMGALGLESMAFTDTGIAEANAITQLSAQNNAIAQNTVMYMIADQEARLQMELMERLERERLDREEKEKDEATAKKSKKSRKPTQITARRPVRSLASYFEKAA